MTISYSDLRRGTVIELEEEPCDYGLVQQLLSVNPVKIAFNEWGNLIHDVRTAKSWKQRFIAAFGYPGDKKAVLEEQARLKAQREKEKADRAGAAGVSSSSQSRAPAAGE